MIRWMPVNTKVVTTAGAKVDVDLKPGVMYRIISNVDCYINSTASTVGTGPDAADEAGMYLPADAIDPHFFSFPASGDPGENGRAPDLKCRITVFAAAGKVFFTEMVPVFA